MSNGLSKLNVPALICAFVMLISCFLPWTEISASVSIKDYSSSYRQTASGIQTGMGVIPCILGLISAVLVFIKTRLIFIPGIINLVFAIMPLTGVGNFSASSSIGQANGGVGFGVYVLLFSSIGYLLFTLFPMGKIIEAPKFNQPDVVLTQPSEHKTSEKAEVEEKFNPIIQAAPELVLSKQPLESKQAPTTETKENTQSPSSAPSLYPLKRNKLSGFQKGLIIIGIIIGSYALIFMWADSSSEKYHQQRTQKENDERQRIEQVIEQVNQAVSNHEYELALASVNSIAWNLDNNQENIEKYEAHRENLKATIQMIKYERDSLEQVQNTIEMEIAMRKDSIWKAESEQGKKENESYPYVATVIANRTFIYKEPDINSDRESVLIIQDRVSILAKQNEFLFCKSTHRDGTQLSGWILYKDIEKY